MHARMAPPDDDDWVGTPPEGRVRRERSDPGFWARQRPLAISGLGLVLALVVLALALAL